VFFTYTKPPETLFWQVVIGQVRLRGRRHIAEIVGNPVAISPDIDPIKLCNEAYQQQPVPPIPSWQGGCSRGASTATPVVQDAQKALPRLACSARSAQGAKRLSAMGAAGRWGPLRRARTSSQPSLARTFGPQDVRGPVGRRLGRTLVGLCSRSLATGWHHDRVTEC